MRQADPSADPNAPVLMITGAAGGIGQAVLRRARADGYRIFAIDLKTRLPSSERDALVQWFEADVTNDEEASRAFVELDHKFGRLDALLPCAGVVGSGRVEEVEPAAFRRLLEINLTSAFLYSRLALPRLCKTRGSIVFVSSTNGLTGGSPLSGPAYAVAKAGLIALTKNIARDYGAQSVRANCVAPGPIDTPMLDRLSDPVKAALRGSIPLGDLGAPEDVANVVAFLISAQAKYLTGLTITISGGMVMP